MSQYSAAYLSGLVSELCKSNNESECVEFKENNCNPEEIGEYLSALANAAALAGKVNGYLLWGIEDGSHEIVGTVFDPSIAKIGNEELESWLLRSLMPKIQFRFHDITLDDKRVVVLEIASASRSPVQFKGVEFIRVGSYKRKLKDFPEKERALWRRFDEVPFEHGVAAERQTTDDVLRLLDYTTYFDLLSLPLPGSQEGILLALAEERLVARCSAGGWDITNLGACLFAKKLDDFSGVARKAMRVIVYKGNSRIETLKEQVGTKGYASGFKGLITYINGLLPANEILAQALRKAVPMYPEIAVRELVANALVHQDFAVTGTGPMVEIFEDRMEITNPGVPLVATERFLDTPPRSRNEMLASLMRRFGVCEERGSGIDKVVFETELYQLPAPVFEVTGESTRAVLFAHRTLTKMDRDDRIRACYLHACLKHVNREFLTNATVRQRFGIEQHNNATASRLIKEAVEAIQIVPHDVDAGPKFMKYVPWWATPAAS